MSLNDATARPHKLFLVLKAKMANFTGFPKVDRNPGIRGSYHPKQCVTGWVVVHAQPAASVAGTLIRHEALFSWIRAASRMSRFGYIKES